MIADALLAYLHFAAVFLLFAFLTVEAMLVREPLDARGVRLIARVDLWYGASALLTLVTGVLRVAYGAKGWDFHSANPLFYGKVALFLVIGALSILPTLRILGWSRQLRQVATFAPADAERRAVRRWVMIEIHLASLLPLAAVLMARGVGL